ncbi:hypothetical protein P43SY_002373 [Pythium insidiosum]|uniref:Uncharacterized protein n=1 Tax=Pythium insidiosum TaxID=114742 RepID=A0AAD5LU26_PYTIN|nr:hypothetical protein P43SY_002373 [Pythium insidiosum]
MGDDPYDFEIAIPTAQHGGTRATGKSKRDAYGARDSRAFRHEDDDDDEEEQEADEGSSDFALSDSEDGDRLASTSRARTMAGGQRQAAGSAPSGKPAGTGGGSALDKAKSFLSKYSVKATAKASTTARESESRTSRLEMSLDDLSLDSSGDEKKPVERRRAENVEAIARKEPPANAVNRTERHDSSSDESDSRSSGGHSRRQSIIEPSVRTESAPGDGKDNDGDSPLRHRELSERESGESEHAWPSSSRHDGGVALRSTKPVESDDDAVESISSRSADSVGEEHSDDRSGAARATEPADSGVYASDAFEEESRGEALADAQQKPSSAESFSQQPRPTAVSMPQEESNFDYSMDFAEDEHAAVPTLAIPPVPDDPSPRGDTRPSRSGSDDDHEEEKEERYSAFLDSEADDIGGFYIAAPGSFGSLNVRLV